METICDVRRSVRCVDRVMFPHLRGTEFRLQYVNPRLHALINGLPKWLADVSILLLRRGKRIHARWVCAAFRQQGRFVPHQDIFAVACCSPLQTKGVRWGQLEPM